MKSKKQITIDDLAIMIKHGFDQTATKDDFRQLDQRIDQLDQRVDKVENIQRDMFEELNTMHVDVRYIRNTVDKLVQSDIAQDATIQDLASRVHRLEQKAGIAK